MTDEPSGLTVEKTKSSFGNEVLSFKFVTRLPHLLLAATMAEEVGRASGSTKLRSIGIPLPYAYKDKPIGVIRLWAIWEKQAGGIAKLTGFEVCDGKKRQTDKRRLILRTKEPDNRLVGYGFMKMGYDTAPMEELQRRFDEAEAAGRSVDPLAVMARNAVTQAGCSFCSICGRVLTDPVSVRTGIGPDCGDELQAKFLQRWRHDRIAIAS